MKRKLLSLWLILLLLLPAAAAQADATAVYDLAEILGSESADLLDEQIEGLETRFKLDIYLVTTNDAGGLTSQEYADDFYDSLSQKDGFLFLIDMDNRAVTFSAAGTAMAYFTDAQADAILDDALPYLSDGEYIAAAHALLDGAERRLNGGISNEQYFYDAETGQITERPPDYTKNALISTVAALAIAGLITAAAVKSYKVNNKLDRYDYFSNSQVEMLAKREDFLHKTTSRRHVARDDSPSSSRGRTTTHRSSSGRTHSGRSRRF